MIAVISLRLVPVGHHGRRLRPITAGGSLPGKT